MSDYHLISAPPLALYDQSFEGVSLIAPADFAVVSIALPLGGEAAALKAIKSAFGKALPDVGKSVLSKSVRLVRMSLDQGFVIFSHATPDAESFVAKKLKDAAYTTDQTDVWTGLILSGPKARTVLERICPIDLHGQAFAVNDTARTTMEHLGTLIIRTGDDEFLLMSASSSAHSFLHAIEISIRNIA